MIKVGNAPSSLKYQPCNLGQLSKINLVNGVRGFVVIHAGAIEIENNRYAMFGIIPVVGTEVNTLRIIGIVIVIIQLQLLVVRVGLFAELMQFLADAV